MMRDLVRALAQLEAELTRTCGVGLNEAMVICAIGRGRATAGDVARCVGLLPPNASKVVRSVHPALDAEAMRVVSSMPRWAPGKIGGKAVRVKYTIPVKFQMPTGTIVDPKAYRQWKKYMKAQSDSTAALRHYKGKNDKKAGK